MDVRVLSERIVGLLEAGGVRVDGVTAKELGDHVAVALTMCSADAADRARALLEQGARGTFAIVGGQGLTVVVCGQRAAAAA